MKDKKGMGPDKMGSRGELEGVQGKETIIRIHYVRKKSICKKRKNKLKKKEK